MVNKGKGSGECILIADSSGFIGANLVIWLLKEMRSDTIVSLDNMNDYYDISLKEYRFDIVVNLAAQARVRHSIDHPDVYIDLVFIIYSKLAVIIR